MRKITCLKVLILMLTLSNFAHGQELPSNFAALTMKIYLGVCVPSGGNYDIVSSAANKMQLTLLPESKTDEFLRGNTGTVWATGDENALLALALTKDGNCTVFVQRIDSSELTALFETWLPPTDASFRIDETHEKSKNGSITRTYAIYRNGKPFQSWVLMVGAGQYTQAAMSVRPVRPDRPDK